MYQSSVRIRIPNKTTAILYNSDGMGYGLFPAFDNKYWSLLKSPLHRAAAYINAYENMLDRKIKPVSLIEWFQQAIGTETNEINLQLITGYLSGVYWQFLHASDRNQWHASLEKTIWKSMQSKTEANLKKILFKSFQDVYLSDDAAKNIYEIWHSQKAPEGIKLAEEDYTSMAMGIALKMIRLFMC